jgi:Family of unknown function (DUF6203)
VRRLVKIALVALGIRWLLKRRKRRREEREAAQLPPTPAVPTADPADELRQKLAASRTEAEPDETEPAPAPSVADRRAEVHGQGRAALDDMQSSDEG